MNISTEQIIKMIFELGEGQKVYITPSEVTIGTNTFNYSTFDKLDEGLFTAWTWFVANGHEHKGNIGNPACKHTKVTRPTDFDLWTCSGCGVQFHTSFQPVEK